MDFFKPSELACKCDRGSECDAKPIDMAALLKLNGLRLEFGQPMTIDSARRCLYWQQKKGTAKEPILSQHVAGKAFDIAIRNGAESTGRLMMLAIRHGFAGIGVAKGFLHLDARDGPLMVWGY